MINPSFPRSYHLLHKHVLMTDFLCGIDGRVAPRSGLASKNFIDVGAGVIDADYRGEVKVLLFNFSETDFTVKEGDRVAQLVLERVCICYHSRVEIGCKVLTDCVSCRSSRPRLSSLRSWLRVCAVLVVLEAQGRTRPTISP